VERGGAEMMAVVPDGVEGKEGERVLQFWVDYEGIVFWMQGNIQSEGVGGGREADGSSAEQGLTKLGFMYGTP